MTEVGASAPPSVVGRPAAREAWPVPRPFFLEKWYIDTLLPNGDVLLVYLGRVRILGVWLARVTADLFGADGRTIGAHAVPRRVRTGPDVLDFDAARVDGEELAFELEGLSGRLTFSPRGRAVQPPKPFLARGGRALSWEVEVPDADVSGALSWPGGGCQVFGRGYRDRIAFDFLPWRLPVSSLEWGRAVAGEHAAVWMRAQTPDAVLRYSWIDGTRQAAAESVRLGPDRTLVHTAIADLPGLRAGPLRPLLRRLTRDPVETKWATQAAIFGVSGLAIHERVVWQ